MMNKQGLFTNNLAGWMILLAILLVSCTGMLVSCTGSPTLGPELVEGSDLSVGPGLQAQDASPTTVPTPTSGPPAFRVIAYVTAAVIPEIIPYEMLTHINYSFLIPKADGSLQPITNAWKLKNLVSQAHEQGVKVLISVGGWGWDKEFEALAADPAKRRIFVENLVSFVDEYGLDGVDMDWEYPDAGQSAQNFLSLMTELRAALPSDALLTAAVVSYGDSNGLGIPDASFELMDFVNIMTYDGPDHGSMEQFERGLAYWQGRGLSPAKTVLGLPFYSNPDGTPYWKIIKQDPAAAQSDSFEYFGTQLTYNGIPTVQEKTRRAMEAAGGVMFWTLEHDSRDELSLLGAIYRVISGERK